MLSSSSQRNRDLIIAKALFFSNAMSVVGWARFQNNFYLDHGLSSSEIGSVKALGLVLKFVGEPMWCIAADLTNAKLVFIFCTLMQILTMELLRTADVITLNRIVVVKVLRTCTAPTSTLTTAASFQLTKGTQEGYGKQRMFGSLAWGIGALFVGCLIDAYGMSALFWYTYVFATISFFVGLFGIPPRDVKTRACAMSISNTDICIEGEEATSELGVELHSASSSSASSSAPSSSSFAPFRKGKTAVSSALCSLTESLQTYFLGLKQFFSHAPSRVLLLNAIAFGLIMSIVDTYLPISLEKDFHASRTINGLSTLVAVLSALPCFYFSDNLLAKYGHYRCISIAQLVGIFRLLTYAMCSPSYSYSLHVIIATQLTQGITFALYWCAVIDAIYKFSPRDCKSGCLGALNVAYFTVGGVIGNSFFGFLYEYGGGIQRVYLVGAIFLVFTVFVFSLSKQLIIASIGSQHPE